MSTNSSRKISTSEFGRTVANGLPRIYNPQLRMPFVLNLFNLCVVGRFVSLIERALRSNVRYRYGAIQWAMCQCTRAYWVANFK